MFFQFSTFSLLYSVSLSFSSVTFSELKHDMFWSSTNISVNANFDWAVCKLWLRSSDYVLFESLLIQDSQTFLFKSYWHAPCAGLVRNSRLNKNFTAAGCSGRHGLLKRESVGLKDYCAAKTGNEIRVLESEEWVSWSKGYILLLRWAWGSSESGTFKTLFKWELQKEINLTSPLSRWSQLRDRETKSCCGETWTSCVCVLECSGAFNSLDL